jgi:peptidoglycan/xylan/chitin deacetylase (PgdA/CDA1 family)
MTDITFDQSGYARIIRTALAEGYTVVPVCEALAAPPKALVLRHDLDYSLDRALIMAELEQSLGVRATFYVMLTNPFYNPLTTRGRGILAQIAGMGHEIGLHWDSSVYPSDPDAAGAHFQHELAMVEAASGFKIRSASQHIPTDNPYLDVEKFIELEAYSNRIVSRYRYVSDSCMVWRGTTPLDLISEGVDSYFCTHPIWWTTPGETLPAKTYRSVAETQSHMNAEMGDVIDYLELLIANRAQNDARFRQERGWSESAS